MSSRRSLTAMRSSGRLNTSVYSAKSSLDTKRTAGGVNAKTNAVRSSPFGLSAAETKILVSMTSLRGSTAAAGSGRLDDAINLAHGELVGTAADRRFPEAL